ncbi:MAG: hypothetical protein M0Z61_08390 [Nitrospiraceae bacterium]|nr:hypothetical protein [Nitrospiraceae bacterium]
MPYNVHFKFLGQYMRKIREVGSIAPDSGACVNGLLKSVKFKSAKVIIEFGSGSGAVTREILRRKRPDAVLICFEKNTAFYDHLRKTITGRNVFIILADVFDAAHVLASRFDISARSVDYIISTLPCSFMRINELLIKAVCPLLNERGAFIQYMHVPSVLKGFRLRPILSKRFSRIESDIVFSNIPPVFIYTCRTGNAPII